MGESRIALQAATGLSPLCPPASACWPGDQAAAAGNVPPVTILAVTSLQPDLRVRTVRARMWLARNSFGALPHPARAMTLPVLALVRDRGDARNLGASCRSPGPAAEAGATLSAGVPAEQ